MLDVRGIRKRYGGLLAVDDASLSLDGGHIVGLIGPNGAGKTTLFAAIAGFVKPDAGTVRLRGEDITGLAPHEICRRGMVRTFQITQPFSRLSVLENIMVGAYVHTSSRAVAMERAQAVAHQVGMGHLLEQPSASLTVAARKRLELARALATRPSVLLLDEVMAGLNPTEIDEIVRVIRDIHASGVSVLLIEHVMRAVMALAGEVYVLSSGRVIARGDPLTVTRDPAVVEAYLGKSLEDGAGPAEGEAHA